MDQEESARLVHASADMVFGGLPHVNLSMSGRLLVKPDFDLEEAFKTRSQYDQFLNWRIDKDADEFVIRFSRNPEAPSSGHINVDVKIEGGLSPQPDGSVIFDGGLGNGEVTKVSKFSLSFEVSHDCSPDSDADSDDSDSQEEWEELVEPEIQFFDHPEHKLVLAPENYYTDVYVDKGTCDACMKYICKRNARWVYECRGCNYCVHVKCAQMARSIRHPNHVKHRLKLLKLDPESGCKGCNVCEASISCGLFYNCAKCDFDVHAKCPKPEEAPGDGVAETEEEQEEQYEGQQQCEEERVTEMTPAMMRLQLMESQLQLQMTQQLAVSIANVGAGVLRLS